MPQTLGIANWPTEPVVYFVAHEELIKIGRAADLHSRYLDLRAKHPGAVLLGWIPFSSFPDDYDLELTIHRQWAMNREHGEWFRGSSAFLQWLNKQAKSGLLHRPQGRA